MKKNLFFVGLAAAFSVLMITGCIYDPPEEEIRPVFEEEKMEIVSTAGGVSDAKINDDGTVTALLKFNKDTGVVIYLNTDKSKASVNSKVSYVYTYQTKDWGDSSVKPKFYVRYGDSASSFSNYDPSYNDKTNYDDGTGSSGEIKKDIVLKNDADAIVFATNAYQWAGAATDTVEITVKKIVVSE